MATIAGQFAGLVHFEVPAANADALTSALQGLESAGMRVVIAKTAHAPPPPGRRMVALELEGPDRPGIVRDLARSLADRGVSIEEMHTEKFEAVNDGHVQVRPCFSAQVDPTTNCTTGSTRCAR
jgi:glycine cleavage system regulatory protein